jgi:uncharacterized protein YqeY
MLDAKISQDYVQAMKAQDKLRSSTLNFLRAQLKNVKIEKKVETVTDVDAVAVIKKQIKQRQDSIEQYTKGGRQDLADKETAELNILKEYLPKELSESELKAIIAETLNETQATSVKDMGKVMKGVMDKVAGNADNKLVSDLVKQSLIGL